MVNTSTNAKVVSFSAPAVYADILSKTGNKSNLIVEALGYYFSHRNYRLKKSTLKPSLDNKTKNAGDYGNSKVHLGNSDIIKKVSEFRKNLPPDKKSISVAEILRYRDEGRS